MAAAGTGGVFRRIGHVFGVHYREDAGSFLEDGCRRVIALRYEEAIPILDEAIRLNSNCVLPKLYKGIAETDGLGKYAWGLDSVIDRISQNKYNDEDIAFFRKCAGLPNHYFLLVAYAYHGITNNHINHHLAAVWNFDEALRLISAYKAQFDSHPDWIVQCFGFTQEELLFKIYYGRGFANLELGHYAAACKDFDEALLHKADDENALFRREMAQAFLEGAQIIDDEATTIFEQALEHRNAKRYEEARKAYTELIRLEPFNALGYFERGRLHWFIHGDREALEQCLRDCDEALRLEPRYHGVFYMRREIYYRLGNEELARQEIEKVVDLGDLCPIVNSAVSWYRVGLDLYYGRQFADSVRAYDEALRLEPNNPSKVLYKRGQAKAHLNKFSEAIEDYDEALQHQPDYEDALVGKQLAEEELKKSDGEDAVKLPTETEKWDHVKSMSVGGAYEGLHDSLFFLRYRFYNSGRFDDLVELCNEMLSDRTYLCRTKIIRYRAVALLCLGHYQEAIEDYQAVLRLQECEEAAAGILLAQVAINSPRTKSSISDDIAAGYRGSHKLETQEEAVVVAAAEAALKAEDRKRAAEAQAEMSCKQAQEHFAAHRYEEACTSYEEALRYKPDFEAALVGKQLVEEAAVKAAARRAEEEALAKREEDPVYEGVAAAQGTPEEVDWDAFSVASTAASDPETVVPDDAVWLTAEDYEYFVSLRRVEPIPADIVSRREVSPVIDFSRKQAQKEWELKYLQDHPNLYAYYCVFQNMMQAIVIGAEAIRADMAPSTGATGLESKMQKAMRYFRNIIGFLPGMKTVGAPARFVFEKIEGVELENKISRILSCFPVWTQAHVEIEQLARGITLALREKLQTTPVDEGAWLMRNWRRFKAGVNNALYVKDLDTPYKVKADIDLHKVIALMAEGDLTRENFTVEHIVTTYLNPGQTLLPSPVASAEGEIVPSEGDSDKAASASGAGGLVRPAIIIPKNLTDAENVDRKRSMDLHEVIQELKKDRNERRMHEARIAHIEAEIKKAHEEPSGGPAGSRQEQIGVESLLKEFHELMEENKRLNRRIAVLEVTLSALLALTPIADAIRKVTHVPSQEERDERKGLLNISDTSVSVDGEGGAS